MTALRVRRRNETHTHLHMLCSMKIEGKVQLRDEIRNEEKRKNPVKEADYSIENEPKRKNAKHRK